MFTQKLAIQHNRCIAIISGICLIMEQIAGLVIALYSHNTALWREMACDDGAYGIEPGADSFIKDFAGIRWYRKLMWRMQSPGCIQVKTTNPATRLHARI